MWPFKKKQPEPTRIQPLLDRMKSNPEEFEITEYVFRHKPTKVEFWIANGFAYFGLYKPTEIRFTLDDKYRFRDALVGRMQDYLNKALSGMIPS